MGFRDPLRTAEGVDTRTSPTGAGARLYQGTVGGFPAGVLEMRDGVAGDAHATLTSTAFLTPQLDEFGTVIGYTSAGRETKLGSGSSQGLTGPALTLSVLAAAAGGYEAVAELLNAVRFTAQRLRLSAQNDASDVSTAHPFQIGPDGGTNLIADGNEIIGRTNGVITGVGFGGGTLNSVGDPTVPSHGSNKRYVDSLTATGKASVSSTANVVVSQTVLFGRTFAAPPSISLTPETSTPQVLDVGYGSVTTTSFTLYTFRTQTTTSVVAWQAVLSN